MLVAPQSPKARTALKRSGIVPSAVLHLLSQRSQIFVCSLNPELKKTHLFMIAFCQYDFSSLHPAPPPPPPPAPSEMWVLMLPECFSSFTIASREGGVGAGGGGGGEKEEERDGGGGGGTERKKGRYSACACACVCVFLSVVTLYTVLYVPVLNNCNVFMFL